MFQQVKSRVSSISRVLSGYLSTAANHHSTAARLMTCHQQLQTGSQTEVQSLQSYMLRKCSSSVENLVQWPLGQGGKMFLLHLSEDVVKSHPGILGLHL